MRSITEVFNLHGAWKLILDGSMVPAEFNSKGAAEAAIPVERERRERKKQRAINWLVDHGMDKMVGEK